MQKKEIQEGIINIYEIRVKFVYESFITLKNIQKNLLKIYAQREAVFDSQYESQKTFFINYLFNLKQSLKEISDQFPTDINNKESELLGYLKKYKKVLFEATQKLSLKNFSGNNNFDRIIDGIEQAIMIKQIGNIKPTLIMKYVVLEIIQDIRMMIVKTEIEALTSFLFALNKIDEKFIDFINSILETVEDGYYQLLSDYLQQENTQIINELESKVPFNSSFLNDLFLFAQCLKTVSTDFKILYHQRHELADRYVYFITQASRDLIDLGTTSSSFFLPKNAKQFLERLENEKDILKQHFLSSLINSLLETVKNNHANT